MTWWNTLAWNLVEVEAWLASRRRVAPKTGAKKPGWIRPVSVSKARLAAMRGLSARPRQAHNIPKARHPDIVYDTNHGGLALARDEAEFHPGAIAKKWTLKPPDNLFDRNRCAIDRSTAAALSLDT
jgi:hypothetical protein